jgi:hypothetical protein
VGRHDGELLIADAQAVRDETEEAAASRPRLDETRFELLLNEATLGKYALGRVLADAAGEAMCRKAEQAPRDLGVGTTSALPRIV